MSARAASWPALASAARELDLAVVSRRMRRSWRVLMRARTGVIKTGTEVPMSNEVVIAREKSLTRARDKLKEALIKCPRP